MSKNWVVAFVLIVAALVVLGVLTVFMGSGNNMSAELPDGNSPEQEPTFAWRFEDAETNNLDGFFQTNIFLRATKGEREIDRLVDTVDGGCSELEGERHDGDVSTTGAVRCYYAGLGQDYRITQGESSYRVERKLFEEALPDIVAPNYEWEVIEEISFE